MEQLSPEVSIYGWWQTPKGEPFDRCPVTEATRLVEIGLATPCKRGKAIQLLKPDIASSWDIRGQSCRMGWRLIVAAILGSRTAQVAAESYRGVLVVA
jgi:hypothetical protein